MRGLPLLVSLPDSYVAIDTFSKELSWSAEDRKRAQRLFDRGLPPLATSQTLPFLFGISPKLVSAMGKFPDRYYRIFEIPKKSGGIRKIEAPRRFLKIVQRWILDHILSTRKLPSFVVGFVKGKSIFDNAKPHTEGKNLMVVDIENFFPL